MGWKGMKKRFLRRRLKPEHIKTRRTKILSSISKAPEKKQHTAQPSRKNNDFRVTVTQIQRFLRRLMLMIMIEFGQRTKKKRKFKSNKTQIGRLA
jgi:hypothetical protein